MTLEDRSHESSDSQTAAAFTNSWTNCFSVSPYILDQFLDWIDPVKIEDLANAEICEMGCGNGGLLLHMASVTRKNVLGVELGESIETAKINFAAMNICNVEFARSDLVSFGENHPDRFDFVYCIGVLHHMKNPKEGFDAVVRSTRPMGRFHCWVYAWEGNYVVRKFVDPIRKIASKLPWRINKYLIALPLAIPFFLISRLVKALQKYQVTRIFPLYDYLLWVSKRGFDFHHHVVFDQLVSPQTTYIRRETVEKWLSEGDFKDCYIIFRNGNSWKFGGVKTA